MSGYKIIVIWLLIGLGTVVRADLREDYHKNIKAASKFRCEPKPRSFRTIDAIRNQNGTQLGTNYYITPAYYVLHVCDQQSGCCRNEDQQCNVKHEEDVTLVFRIITINSKNSEYTQITTTNHTHCQCSVDPIKRFSEKHLFLETSTATKNYKNNLLNMATFSLLIFIWKVFTKTIN